MNRDGPLEHNGITTTGNQPNQTVDKIVIQPDNKILIGGSLDPSFAQTVNGPVYALKIQADGKFLIGGGFGTVGGTGKTYLARLGANGALDSTFNAAPSNTVRDIRQQTADKALIGGEFTKVNGASRLRVARLLNVTVPPRHYFDYDGDGRADIAVYRPSTGIWYLLQTNSGFGAVRWGVASDTPTENAFLQ